MPILRLRDSYAFLPVRVRGRFLFGGEGVESKKYTKDDCLSMLRDKYSELQAAGLARYPQRSDFEESEIMAVKAFLGPWPRALEAAQIKPPRADDRKRKNREKRIRAKRAGIAARILENEK